MDRSIIGICMLLIITGTHLVNAQAQKSLPETDSLTYTLFQQKNWNELISQGNQALGSGIDYYYLRVRLGIAFYEKQNFHLAAKHFEKALSMNETASYVKEYLYYAYLFAGRQAEANMVAAEFSPDLRIKTETENRSFVTSLDLAYNYTGTTDQDLTNNFTADIPMEIDGYQLVPKQHQYFFLGLEHQLSERWSFYQGYSHLVVNQLWYSQASSEILQENDFQSGLDQYFALASFLATKGLTLAGGFHYIHSKYQIYSQGLSGPPGRPVTSTVATPVSNNEMVGIVSFIKRFEYISLGANYFRGNLSDFIQHQTDLKLILYPLGNLNLYSTTTASYQNQDYGDGTKTNSTIIDQELGMKATNWSWLEAYGTFGEMDNFFMKDGLVIFNRTDKIKQRFGGRLILIPKPKWRITLDYSNLNNESQFIPTSNSGENYNQKDYRLHSITLISSWRF